MRGQVDKTCCKSKVFLKNTVSDRINHMDADRKPIVSTIKMVMPAVVSIVISKHLEDIEKEIPKDLYQFSPDDKGWRKMKLPESLADSRGMVQVGGGSGFVVESDGVILTNKHVVGDANAEYTIITNDEKKFAAKVLSRDPINDVAILKTNPPAGGFPIVKLGSAMNLELGEQVIAIGNALGIFKNTVSSGIISGLSRAIAAQADPNAPPQEMRGLIQTDAAINVGNSGGPLVTLNGETVGINAAIVFGAQNISFAIPIDAAKRDLADIKKYGRIKRPFLGVRYIMIDENLQAKMKLPVNYGALIAGEGPNDHGIVKGGPAEKAGIREKDIVLTVNGRKLDRNHPIQDFLENMNVGDELDMLILRGEKEKKLKVQLTERV